MIATLVRLTVFAAGIALLLELSLRVHYFGLDGLFPSRIDSYRVILDSDLIQPAESTTIWYELKPNLNTLLAGKEFRTNSAGLADREYSLAKPDGTFRIAVAGSSWSMATGVATGDTYHALLEEQLQQLWPDRNVEVINFAVEYYGLGEITATIREKILAWEPDLILVAITSTTPVIIWDDNKEPFTRQPITPPFLQSYLVSRIASAFGRPKFYYRTKRPTADLTRAGGTRNINRAMIEFEQTTADHGIPVVALSLTHTGVNESAAKHMRNVTSKRGVELIELHLDDLAETAGTSKPFLTDKFSLHPNELGHKLIADAIFAYLKDRPTGY